MEADCKLPAEVVGGVGVAEAGSLHKHKHADELGW